MVNIQKYFITLTLLYAIQYLFSSENHKHFVRLYNWRVAIIYCIGNFRTIPTAQQFNRVRLQLVSRFQTSYLALPQEPDSESETYSSLNLYIYIIYIGKIITVNKFILIIILNSNPNYYQIFFYLYTVYKHKIRNTFLVNTYTHH